MNILTIDDVMEYAKNHPEVDVEAEKLYKRFRDRFDYKKLKTLDGDELLNTIFAGTNQMNLCYTLEFSPDYYHFGSVSVSGNMYVYGLFKRKTDLKWCVKYEGYTGELDEYKDDPVIYGRKIRDDLVRGAEDIEKWTDFDTEDGYRRLYKKLETDTHGMIKQMWFKKYYHMIFPERFPTFYRDTFVYNVLNDFGLSQDGDFYLWLGRLALYAKKCEVSTRMMGEVYDILVSQKKLVGKPGPSGPVVNPTTNTAAINQQNTGNTTMEIKYPRNRIFFGAPGTGKSYLLNRQQKEYFNDGNVERVTFHPDYSYANFVGAYKPVTETKTATVALDPDVCEVVSVLTDKSKSGQGKYDALFDRFRNSENLTRLPLLLSLYSIDGFRTKKYDGSYTANNNDVEINHGKALQKYVRPYFDTDGETSSEIEYRYVPGPFMRVYTEAVRHPDKNYLLIIEEINRANVAAVFGDVFQLLDRTEEGGSEYPIQASEDIRNFLARELGGAPNEYKKISIPANMYIWATMNSADQGVFPMDTAFKRRWDFEYIGIDDSEEGIVGKYVQLANGLQKVEWNKLRKAINDYLAENKINEDKQLGPYFIAKDIVAPKGSEIDAERFISTFKNKVIMYLYEDAARQKRDDLFDGCDGKRYSEICKEFDEKGYEIFNQSVVDKLS